MDKAVGEDVPSKHTDGQVVTIEHFEAELLLLNSVKALLDLFDTQVLETALLFLALHYGHIDIVHYC